MKKILHIITKGEWNANNKEYRTESLLTQGFIHCSTPNQVVEVANFLFKGRNDLQILVIDASKVKNIIKYEDAGDGELYPHIYGALNIDAVISVLDFNADQNGLFVLPKDI